MPTYNVSVAATNASPVFVCNVPSTAVTVVITQSPTGGQWDNPTGHWWQPQGTGYPTIGPTPGLSPTSASTDWTIGGGSQPSDWSIYWTGTPVAGSTPVPFASMYIAVPGGSGPPTLPYHCDTLGNWFRPNTGPTTYNVGLSAGQIPPGYDLYVLGTNDLPTGYTDNTGTLSATVVVNTPPNVPVLSAVSGCIGGQAVLSWTSSLSTGAASYSVYRDGTFLVNLTGETLTYNDTGLVTGTPHTYRVTSTGTNGLESAKSNTVTVTPCLDPPTGLRDAAGGVCVGTQADLAWLQTDSVGAYLLASQVTANIYQAGNVVATGVIGLGFIIAGLTLGTAYSFQVSVTDAWGNESAKSLAVVITPCALPGGCCVWTRTEKAPPGVWTRTEKSCS